MKRAKVLFSLFLVLIITGCTNNNYSKTVIEEEIISYRINSVEDSTIENDFKVIVAGVNGVRTTTYEVFYENDEPVDVVEISREITKQPVDEKRLVKPLDSGEGNKEPLFERSTMVSYRMKNSFENLFVNIDNIEYHDSLYGGVPKNGVFMVMEIRYSGNLSRGAMVPSKIHGPKINYTKITGADNLVEMSYYESCNSKWCMSDAPGNISKVINEEKYGSSYISDKSVSEGQKKVLLVFDVDKETSRDKDNYLLIPSKAKPGEEKDHPDVKIYFNREK